MAISRFSEICSAVIFSPGVQKQLNRWIEIAGSQEKLEEYRKESINEIRNDMHDEFKNQQINLTHTHFHQ